MNVFLNHITEKRKKTKANSKNWEFVLWQPEVTSLSHGYLSLKMTKYFIHIISYQFLLYFMHNLQNDLLKAAF